jgi:uncharacterized short protein YbdD (DUF466 family)
MRKWWAPLQRAQGVVRDVLSGATGADAYERYCTHLKTAHPELPLPTRASYFKDTQAARWHGVCRCC